MALSCKVAERVSVRRFLWVMAVTFLASPTLNSLAASQSGPTRAGRETQAEAKEAKRLKEKEKLLDQKLDKILANQELILKRFDEVMEELRIIKVRATR